MPDMKRLAANLLLPLTIAAVAIAIKALGFAPLEAITLGAVEDLRNYLRPIDQFDLYQIEKLYKTRQNVVVVCPCCRC
jgi:hypothetical protein